MIKSDMIGARVKYYIHPDYETQHKGVVVDKVRVADEKYPIPTDAYVVLREDPKTGIREVIDVVLPRKIIATTG